MDEPTAHLDHGNQIKVLRLVKELATEGYGVVLTTHNPQHITHVQSSSPSSRSRSGVGLPVVGSQPRSV